MSFAQPGMRVITPECENMGPSVTLSSILLLVATIIVFILLIVGCAYGCQKSKDTGKITPAADGTKADETTTAQEKVVNAHNEEIIKKTKPLLLTSTIIVGVLLAIETWSTLVAGKLRKCLRRD